MLERLEKSVKNQSAMEAKKYHPVIWLILTATTQCSVGVVVIAA